MPEAAKVNSMFANIASRYDLANRLLSLGIDTRWRNRLVKEVRLKKAHSIVDLATGSGDVAFALRSGLDPSARITGIDFCAPMIEEAKKKQTTLNEHAIEFLVGDILHLPLETSSVDAITLSFGYRNLENRHEGLKEIKRALKPKAGHLFLLEFSQPYPLFRPFYYFYLKKALPRLAGLITGNRSAYEYLCQSIETFPDREGVTEELRLAGFKDIVAYPMTLGTVALHIGQA